MKICKNFVITGYSQLLETCFLYQIIHFKAGGIYDLHSSLFVLFFWFFVHL